MAVELEGTVKMHADSGPGVTVRVIAHNRRLRIVSGNELVGEWPVEDIGIKALQEGFTIKAEGEEFLLNTSDDVAFADEIGLTAVSPRLARRMAVRHNPDEPVAGEDPPVISTRLGAIGFALGGALVVLGGFFLNDPAAVAPATLSSENSGGFEFWLAFVIGGVLMVAAAFIMSLSAPIGRIVATVVLVAMIVAFGFAVSRTDIGSNQLTAYGFVAGGLVVGVAVMASGSLRQTE